MPTTRLSVIPRDIAKRPVATNGERLNMIRLVWILGMGIGVLASVATFFGTEPSRKRIRLPWAYGRSNT